MSEADAITEGIANAIAAHDFEAALDMLRVLTQVDARRAAVVYDAICLVVKPDAMLRPLTPPTEGGDRTCEWCGDPWAFLRGDPKYCNACLRMFNPRKWKRDHPTEVEA